jgi:hypothetical protein
VSAVADVRTTSLPVLYPLPAPQTDDVGDVLKLHGLPPVQSGADLVRLHLALFAFLYDTNSWEVSR